MSKKMEFQSSLPAGGATAIRTILVCVFQDFNPRSPRGERLVWKHWREFCGEFQSSLPAGGATFLWCFCCSFRSISILAPRGGSDSDVNHDFIKSFTISILAPRGGSDSLQGE